MQGRKDSGFTLIELLVVIAVIGVLASVVLASINSAKGRSRDARRMDDMLQLQTAVEMYKNDNGSYPLSVAQARNRFKWGSATCDMVFRDGSTLTSADVSGPNAYIQGLTPNYIPVLPVDPGPPPTNPPATLPNCYGYLYNSDGENYMIIDLLSPESYPTSHRFTHPNGAVSGRWMLCSKPELGALCGLPF